MTLDASKYSREIFMIVRNTEKGSPIVTCCLFIILFDFKKENIHRNKIYGTISTYLT